MLSSVGREHMCFLYLKRVFLMKKCYFIDDFFVIYLLSLAPSYANRTQKAVVIYYTAYITEVNFPIHIQNSLTTLKTEKFLKDNQNLEKVSIGFPCISTGIYGYPKDEACKIAIDTIKECINENIEVKFVCYDELDYKLYINHFNGIVKSVFDL